MLLLSWRPYLENQFRSKHICILETLGASTKSVVLVRIGIRNPQILVLNIQDVSSWNLRILVKEPRAGESLLPNGVDRGSWKWMLNCAVGSLGPALLTEPDAVSSSEGFPCRLKVVHSFKERRTANPPPFPPLFSLRAFTQNAVLGGGGGWLCLWELEALLKHMAAKTC